MTLDEVIREGKKDRAVVSAAGKIRENPISQNFNYLVEAEGREGELDRIGLDLGDLQALTGSQYVELANHSQEGSVKRLVDAVKNNYEASISGLGDGEEGRNRIAGLVGSVKPLGDSSEVEKAHKHVYDAFGDLSKPNEAIKRILSEDTDSVVVRAATMLVIGHPRMTGLILNRRLNIAVGAFGEKLENVGKARNYLNALYTASDDNRLNIAYALGQTLTEIELSKDKKKD